MFIYNTITTTRLQDLDSLTGQVQCRWHANLLVRWPLLRKVYEAIPNVPPKKKNFMSPNKARLAGKKSVSKKLKALNQNPYQIDGMIGIEDLCDFGKNENKKKKKHP